MEIEAETAIVKYKSHKSYTIEQKVKIIEQMREEHMLFLMPQPSTSRSTGKDCTSGLSATSNIKRSPLDVRNAISLATSTNAPTLNFTNPPSAG